MNFLLTRLFRFLSFCVIFVGSALVSFGQNEHCPSFRVSFQDSLIANNTKKVLFNSAEVFNPGQKTVILDFTVQIPDGWQLLGKDLSLGALNLAPGEKAFIPINLVRMQSAVADWAPVEMMFWQRHVRDTHRYAYRIRTEAVYNFKAMGSNSIVLLKEEVDQVQLGVQIKNTGNVSDHYELNWENQHFAVHGADIIHLGPGKDTQFTKIIKVDRYAWRNLHKEEVNLLIRAAGTEKTVQKVYSISKYRNVVKLNDVPYDVIPLRLESGVMNVGEEHAYYYGVSGGYRFNAHRDLRFFYRSRQIGSNILGLQRDIFRVDYTHDKWLFSAGQISSIGQFIVNGNGLSIGRKGKDNEFSLSASIHDPAFFYKNDNFTGSVGYKIGSIGLRHTAIANFDRTWNINSYIMVNDVIFAESKDFVAKVTVGAGIEEKTVSVPGIQKEAFGYTLGYFLSKKLGNWFANSQVQHYSKDFSGFNRGLRLHMHSFGRRFGDATGELFYSSNSITRNVFRDSLYNSDILSYNNARFGVRGTLAKSTSSSSISTGVMKQKGIGGLYGMNELYFLDLGHSMFSTKGNSLNVFVQSAYGKEDFDVFVMNASATVNRKLGGMTGVYSLIPDIRQEGEEKLFLGYISSFNGGPFLNFNFFRRALNGSVSYNLSKTSSDDRIRQGVGAGIRYRSDKLGLQAQLNGYFPIGAPNPDGGYERTRYGQFSISKDLNIPIISKRKYFDLRIVLFHDLNDNGLRESNEPYLSNVSMTINDDRLSTNQKGEIKYRNIPPGVYQISLLDAKTGDLIPSKGPAQTAEVMHHTELLIPFKKGRVLTGNLEVILDSLSNTVFTPDMITISASDSNNRNYTTLTDHNGDFQFVLPEGVYRVYLKSSTFDGSNFKPNRMSFNVDLIGTETVPVKFIVKQKKREIRFLNQDGAGK